AAVNSPAHQKKSGAWNVLPEYRGGAEKIGLIFHNVVSSDQSDQQSVLLQTQFGAHGRSSLFGWREPLEIEAVGNDRPSVASKPEAALMEACARAGVADDSQWQSGEPCAGPDRRGCR